MVEITRLAPREGFSTRETGAKRGMIQRYSEPRTWRPISRAFNPYHRYKTLFHAEVESGGYHMKEDMSFVYMFLGVTEE
jgi:hypothetical protein